MSAEQKPETSWQVGREYTAQSFIRELTYLNLKNTIFMETPLDLKFLIKTFQKVKKYPTNFNRHNLIQSP